MTLIAVFAVIGTMQFFTEPQVLRPIAAGALNASYTPNIYAYSLAFSYSDVNYSAAISFALAAVVFGASFAFLFLTRRRSGF
jgi:multiple sugar transport system permease protein